jgi:hypothetical protein
MAETPHLGIEKPISEHDATKVATYNAAFDEMDAAIAGFVQISIAAADVTLTRRQALNKAFKLTGTLTGNRVLKFPHTGGSARAFNVWNATSGAFSVTVKTTAVGSTGIVVTQTKKQLIFHDNVNCYAGAAEVA